MFSIQVSQKFRHKEERPYEQYREGYGQQVEIFVYKGLDRGSETPYKPCYEEETHASSHDRSDDEHEQKGI